MSPDGPTKPLPEEKLLKLIRDKKLNPAAREGAGAQGVTLGPPIASDQRTGVLGFRWPAFAAGSLGAVLLIEASCLVIQLVRPVPAVSMPVGASPPSAAPSAGTTMARETPSLAQSAPPTLFALSANSTSPTSDSRPRTAPSAAVKLLTARLTLMGVVAGNPAQAIIEDSQTKKTYFVTTGQVVVDGAVLEQVLDNRVILDFEGEKIELTL